MPDTLFGGSSGTGTGSWTSDIPGKKKGDRLPPTGNPVIDDILGKSGDEAYRIRDEEETRGNRVEGFLGDEFNRANKATLTDEDIARMFTSQSDAAARTSLDQEAGLRANLGASGIQGGGYAAGLLTGFEGQRLATVTDARRSLAITKAQSDATDRLERFKRAGVLAQQMGRDPSVAGSDYLNSAAGIVLGKYGIDEGNNAARDKGKNDLLGGIIGGVGSLLGGIL